MMIMHLLYNTSDTCLFLTSCLPSFNVVLPNSILVCFLYHLSLEIRVFLVIIFQVTKFPFLVLVMGGMFNNC